MARIVNQSSGAPEMMAFLSNIEMFVQQSFVTHEKALVTKFNDLVLRLTPVWEGTAIVNYRWSINEPDFGVRPPEGQSIPPGPTNSMPLGAEPRRAVNEAVVREQLARALTFTVPSDIYLTNSAPHFLKLEFGLLPTPERTRTNGMVRLAIKEIFGRLK